MNILSLDFATKKTGFAILNEKEELLDYGLIVSSEDNNIYERILEIREKVKSKITQWKPSYIIIEDCPVASSYNLKVAHDLLIGHGAMLGLACQYGIGFMPYQPGAWRSVMGMYDGTRKSITRDYQKPKAVEVANSMYGLDLKYYKYDNKKNISDDDIAEAILLGVSHLRSGKDGKEEND
jgi:Holliday junction resolvasome RuvABC endonuclease subunit